MAVYISVVAMSLYRSVNTYRLQGHRPLYCNKVPLIPLVRQSIFQLRKIVLNRLFSWAIFVFSSIHPKFAHQSIKRCSHLLRLTRRVLQLFSERKLGVQAYSEIFHHPFGGNYNVFNMWFYLHQYLPSDNKENFRFFRSQGAAHETRVRSSRLTLCYKFSVADLPRTPYSFSLHPLGTGSF